MLGLTWQMSPASRCQLSPPTLHLLTERSTMPHHRRLISLFTLLVCSLLFCFLLLKCSMPFKINIGKRRFNRRRPAKIQSYTSHTRTIALFSLHSLLPWSVAVLTTRPHSSKSAAFRQAVWTPRFIRLTSSATTRSHVELGLPWGHFQDDGGFWIAACTARR